MALGPNEKSDKSILKFESMLRTDEVYFFDAEDFQEIIHHYLDCGKIGLAKRALQIGLGQHPKDIELKLLEVEILVFENRFEAAELLLDELEHIDVHNEEIYIQRANIKSKQDQHEEAIHFLHKANHLAQDSVDIHSLLGMEYLFLDNYEMAKKNFISCLEFDIQDYAALYNIVYCFEALEDYEGAIHYLNDYLEKDPYSEVAWHQLGKMYSAKEMFTEALTAFDFAIISDEAFVGAYLEKGKILEKMGQYNEAILNYETSITLEDPTSYAYLRIGKCHQQLENWDLAKNYFHKTVSTDPLLDKGWIAITNFYHQQKDLQKALKYSTKALNIDRENSKYWQKCAEIYTDLCNWDEAHFSFEQAVNFGNYELEVWLGWAKALKKIEDWKRGVAVLIQAVDCYPYQMELNTLLSGFYCKCKKIEEAKKYLAASISQDADAWLFFTKEFPEFAALDWVKTFDPNHNRAST